MYYIQHCIKYYQNKKTNKFQQHETKRNKTKQNKPIFCNTRLLYTIQCYFLFFFSACFVFLIIIKSNIFILAKYFKVANFVTLFLNNIQIWNNKSHNITSYTHNVISNVWIYLEHLISLLSHHTNLVYQKFATLK